MASATLAYSFWDMSTNSTQKLKLHTKKKDFAVGLTHHFWKIHQVSWISLRSSHTSMDFDVTLWLFDSAVIGLRNPTTSAANVNFQGPLWFEKAAPHNFPTTRKGDLHDLRVAPRSTGNAGGNTSLGFVTTVCWCNTNGNHFKIQHTSKNQQKLDLQVPSTYFKGQNWV